MKEMEQNRNAVPVSRNRRQSIEEQSSWYRIHKLQNFYCSCPNSEINWLIHLYID